MSSKTLSDETIFEKAIALPADERSSYLDRACGSDIQLRARIAGLILAHETPDNLLDRPAFEPTTAAPCTEIGALIGPFKLIEKIGEGGFGVVYLAQQEHPVRREVALKIVKPGMDTEQTIARFEIERQALAVMDHPNIAKVFEAGTTDSGQPYFVMELIKGVPITDYCDRCNLDIHDRLVLFVRVCQAVQHAHQKGIIHRDIKPTNVLIAICDGQPTPKIIDFGVAKDTAKRIQANNLRTGFAQMLGTPIYMSPEQAEMSALDVDTRTDVYSLGVLLYELLTGTTPFEESRLQEAAFDEIRRVIREEDPPRPSARLSTLKDAGTIIADHRRSDPSRLARTVRGDLDWIAMKALEKDRTRRYETANAFARDVERFQNQEPVDACPPSVGYRLSKLYRRNRLIFSTVAVIAATIIVAGVISIWLAIRATHAEAEAQTRFHQQQQAHLAENAARLLEAKQREIAERRLFASHVSEARALRREVVAGRRFQSLARIRDAAKLAERLEFSNQDILRLRNEAIASLALFDLKPDIKWPGHPPKAWHDRVSFDRNLEHYVRAEPDGKVVVRRVSDNSEVSRVTLHYQSVNRPELRLSPDGRLLAVRLESSAGRQTGLTKLWRLSTPVRSEPELVLKAETGGYNWDRLLDFSPDSTQIGTVSSNGRVCIYDTGTGEIINQLTIENGNSTQVLRFHPGGEKVAVGDQNLIRVFDIQSGIELDSIPHPDLRTFTWSPDGRHLAVAGRARDAEWKITIWDTILGKPRVECLGHDHAIIHLEYDRLGKLLVSWSWDGTTRIWNPRNGKPMLSSPGRGIQFSNDGRFLGFGYAGVEIARQKVIRSEVMRVLDDTRSASAVSFDADGRILVTAHDLQGIRFWDVQRETEIGQLATGSRAKFLASGDQLLLAGQAGCASWQLKRNQNDGELQMEMQTEFLPVGSFQIEACLTQDQRTLAVTESYGKLAFVDTLNGQLKRKIDASGYKNVSISPDGRWAAAAPWNSFTSYVVWDLSTGDVEARLPQPTSISGKTVVFSPDGKWLVTNDGSHYLFWAVGSWEQTHKLSGDGPVTFTQDGSQFAISHKGTAQLYESHTMRPLAVLEAPSRQSIVGMTFDFQGIQLAVCTIGGVQVWNLRQIRKQLEELGLDWELPPYPANQPNFSTISKVQIDLGDNWSLWHAQAANLAADGKWKEAIASYGKAVDLGENPDQDHPFASQEKLAQLYNSFAWLLCICPDPDFRDGRSAVELAKKAIRLVPNDGYFWNTRGAAHVRAGQWREAIDALEKSMELGTGGDSYDWFFLAMAHHGLGNTEEAHIWFTKAVTWADQNDQDNVELRRFRAEVGQTLNQSMIR